jgi:chromosome segregation ATPase
MPDDPHTLRLLSQMEALRAERDAALGALDTKEREAEDGMRLLVEEQDRFVSRLIESHEREVGKLRLELEEARTSAGRFEQKLERERATLGRMEDQIAVAHVELNRLREQRDSARQEAKRAQQGYVTAQATIDALRTEVDLSRSVPVTGQTVASERNSGVRPPPLPPRRDRLVAGVPPRISRDSAPPSSR